MGSYSFEGAPAPGVLRPGVRNNIVYNQCWEEPVVDREALDLRPEDRVSVSVALLWRYFVFRGEA